MDSLFNLDTELTPSQKADCGRAAYFVLEVTSERFDRIQYLPIEDGEDRGFYSLSLGVASRPPVRLWWDCAAFDDAMAMTQALRDAYPRAGLWLRCEGVLAEIEGPDVLRGLIGARAANSFPGDDDEDEWLALSRGVAADPIAAARMPLGATLAGVATHCG